MFSSAVVIQRTTCTLTLTADTLTWKPEVAGPRGTAGSLLLYDVYGTDMACLGEECGFIVQALVQKPQKPLVRLKVVQRFVTATTDEADQWVSAIRSVLGGVPIGHPPPPRRLLVLVNPVGGTRKAVPIYTKHVQRFFECARIHTTVLLTTHALHATEIGREMDLTAYDGAVTVSGDGLLHELINGLLDRDDWRDAVNMPIALIPAGSGNGLAQSLDVFDLHSAILNAIKGHTTQFDVLATRQGNKVRYSHLGIYFGIVADVDIGSEKYRWAGSARFTMAAVARLINMRKYRARLSYLPFDEDERGGAKTVTAASATADVADGDQAGPSEETRERADSYGTAISMRPEWHLNGRTSSERTRDGWRTVECPFAHIIAMNVAWASNDSWLAPYAGHADGAIHLVWADGDDPMLTKKRLISMFLDLENGNSITQPFIHYMRVKAFSLEPLEDRGIVDVDGEKVDLAPLHVELMPSLLRVMVPPTLKPVSKEWVPK